MEFILRFGQINSKEVPLDTSFFNGTLHKAKIKHYQPLADQLHWYQVHYLCLLSYSVC